ncbi:MAG: SH3 domain-containing protein [Candidatus Omnitrophica bacterium]|nr:SH3 domain-containing protein [Candidatus Omnitrophota bacterium]
MNKNFLHFGICLLLIFISPCFAFPGENPGYAAPSVLPHTSREMRTPGFWISRHPFPDRVILDDEDILRFNQKTEHELKLIKTITVIGPVYPGDDVRSQLREGMGEFLKNRLYVRRGKRAGRRYFVRIRENMNIGSIAAEVPVRYAFVRRCSDQRLLPTADILTERPFDADFDQVQNSSLDAGTPMAVLHETMDGMWCYGITPASSGWVRKEQIVFCSLEDMRVFTGKKDFYVVTGPKADIFLDPACTQYFDTVRMGAKFPVWPGTDGAAGSSMRGEETVCIEFPFSGGTGAFYVRQAYVRREGVHKGFLRYTPRTVIEQAFKMLNAPYGWGGVNGEQDCSAFLQEVFAVVGISLPRNSGAQGQTGHLSADFSTGKSTVETKYSFLRENGIPGVSILQLKGHVLLYLGEMNGRLYAIHDTSGYREKFLFGERVRRVMKVVVSDLYLGEGGSRGSLLDRLLRITNVFLF